MGLVRVRYRLVGAALAVVTLVVHARGYLPFIGDDALISLRYARRLLDGHGLTWTDGVRVEGYSNLLWILSAAALGRLGLDLILAARVLGVAGMSAAIVAIAASRSARAPAWAAVVACAAFALSAPVAAWAIGGLEQPLVAALLAWSVALVLRALDTADPPPARALIGPGVLMGLGCWARPDGPVLVAGLGVGLLLAHGSLRRDPRPLLALVVPPVACVLAQLAFRRVYYDEWLPNPAFAKLAFTFVRLRGGLGYVLRGLCWMAPLVLAAASGLVAPRRDAGLVRRQVVVLAVLTAWGLYVVSIGGDLFPARRHLVPVVLLLCILLGDAIEAWRVRPVERALPAMSAAAAMLGLLFALQWQDPESVSARQERWEWRGEVVGRLLARAFGDRQPLLAVDPAGCVPYFSGLPSIDMLGLNDRFLAHHPPHGMGEGRLGHELGDGAYVLARQPDLVLFTGPGGAEVPRFPSAVQLAADPRFRARYRLVRMDGFDPFFVRTRIWVRKEGGALGVRRERDRVVVPGWLLCADTTEAARLDASGRLGMIAHRGHPATMTDLALSPGRWRVRADVVVAHALEVRVHSNGALLARGTDGVTFAIPVEATETVDLTVTPSGDTLAIVRDVVLERLDSPLPGGTPGRAQPETVLSGVLRPRP